MQQKAPKLLGFSQTSLLFLLVALLPSNLFIYLDLPSAYSSGIRIDYLLPKFQLTDILIVGLFICWVLSKPKIERIQIRKLVNKNWILLSIVLLLFLRQFFSINPTASLLYVLKSIEFGWLGWYLYQFPVKTFKQHWFLGGWMLGMLGQSCLAILQFAHQKTIVGYWFLGEPKLSSSLLIAQDVFGYVEKILPYGTTPHPNILAGYLGISLIFISTALFYSAKNQLNSKATLLGFFLFASVVAVAVGLTHSFSAYASLLLGGMAIWITLNTTINLKRIFVLTTFLGSFFGFVFPFIGAEVFPMVLSLTRRALLNQSAVAMFLSQPVFGVGLNTFTTNLANYNPSGELYHFFQPAHHLLTLIITEGGITTIFIVLNLSFKYLKQTQYISPLLFTLIPLAFWDHYLLTTQQGLLLVVFSLVLATRIVPVVTVR